MTIISKQYAWSGVLNVRKPIVEINLDDCDDRRGPVNEGRDGGEARALNPSGERLRISST